MVTAVVRVLDSDAALADRLDPSEHRRARRHLVAQLQHAGAGAWHPPRLVEEPFGMLVLDGVLVRRLAVAGRSSVELLGEGDIVRPWQATVDEDSVAPEASWQALHETTLAVLDREFIGVATHWPEIMIALAERLVRRSRALGLRLALAQAPSVSARVLVVLWHLADRWGRVTPAGTVLSLRLSQGLWRSSWQHAASPCAWRSQTCSAVTCSAG